MRRDDLLTPGTYAAIPKALLALPSTTLSPGAKLVWMAIVERFGENDGAWPGTTTIARDAGLTKRGVLKALDQIARLRALAIFTPEMSLPPGHSFPPNRKRTTNYYRATGFTGEQSTPVNGVHPAGEQSSPPPVNGVHAPGERSSPELPNRTTQRTTGGTTQDCAAAPLGASGPGRPVGGSSLAVGDQEDIPPATDTTQAPATRAVSRPSASSRKPAARAPRKSAATKQQAPVDVALVCSDLNSMRNYLISGSLDWRQFQKGEDLQKWEDLGVDEWGARQFTGYYWFQVSAYRVNHGLELTLPPFTKLLGIFKNLLKQVTKPRLYQIIIFVVFYFDVIRWMLRRAGNSVYLDENSLVNPLVQQCANNLMAMTHIERGGLVEQFKQETGLGVAA